MSEESRKEKIRSMIDSIVDDNQEQAEVDFHSAATDIVKGLIGVPTEPEYTEVEADEYIPSDDESSDED